MQIKKTRSRVLLAHAAVLMAPRAVATLPHALMVHGQASEAACNVRNLAFFSRFFIVIPFENS